MTIPYFTPTKIDGSPRRPLVERVPECRATASENAALYFDGHLFRWRYEHNEIMVQWPGSEDVSIALRLSRLACMEWLQKRCRSAGCDSDIAAWCESALMHGASDATYNELADRLADAMGVPH